jgi:hypothetical protein
VTGEQPPGGPRAAEPPRHPGLDAPPERYGPLTVERRRKEDGRLLILYSRTREPAEGR